MSDPVPFISYAQHGEDVIIWRALGNRPRGFYVDVGAFHPSFDSVTRALYERGWRGLNIEPQPDRHAEFERDRPGDLNLTLAIGDRDGTARLNLPENPGWASLLDPALTGADVATSRILEVPIRRLDTLLAELGIDHVDVLKIDVEGAEPGVVRGLLGGPIRPLVCVVEGVGPGIGRVAGDEAVAMLVAAGYVHCLFDGLNHYLTTDPALEHALSVPANPLDGYTTDLLNRLHHERQALLETNATLRAENRAVRASRSPAFESDASATDSERAGDGEIAAPFDGGDLPIPAPEAFATDETPIHELRTVGPALGGVDPDTRRARRRATFQRILRGEPTPMPPRAATREASGLLSLAVGEHEPADAVAVLYREIVERDADPDGLAVWVARLEAGEPLLKLALEIAGSGEALVCPLERRVKVRSQLALWQTLVAVTELGATAWPPKRAYTPGVVAHEVFVGALFEAALQRPPSPQEAAFEVSRLVSGAGRERLLRAYAARPELRDRLLGRPTRRLRGRLRRWLDGRHVAAAFRDMVTAAEARRVAELLAGTGAEGLLLDEHGRVRARRTQEI